MELTVYNPQKGRLETLEVEFTDDNTTWFEYGRTPRLFPQSLISTADF